VLFRLNVNNARVVCLKSAGAAITKTTKKTHRSLGLRKNFFDRLCTVQLYIISVSVHHYRSTRTLRD